MASKGQTVSSWARYLKASCLLYHVAAMVRVEDVDDIPFWQSVLSATCPGKRFKFLPYSQKGSNTHVTGKSYLLKYVSQADSRLLIAIDSDFDYLRGNPKMSASPYLLQTYTYSWENHYCYAQSLQHQWQTAYDDPFDFGVFLSNLSQVVYLPLVILLIHKIQKKGGITLGLLESRILRHQPNSKALLDDNGSQLLSEIREDVDSRIVKLNKLKQSTLSKYQQAFRRLGLTEENAYLYMQGHCVYDLVSRIGSSLTGDSAGFKAQVLDKTLQVGGYYEIDRLISDIRKISQLM